MQIKKVNIFVGRTMRFFLESLQFNSALYHYFTKNVWKRWVQKDGHRISQATHNSERCWHLKRSFVSAKSI